MEETFELKEEGRREDAYLCELEEREADGGKRDERFEGVSELRLLLLPPSWEPDAELEEDEMKGKG